MNQPLLTGMSATASVSATGDFPETLRLIADTVERYLREIDIDADRAKAVGENVAEAVREQLGGQLVYIQKGRSMMARRRYELIYAEFTGDNQADLARRHGMGLQRIYRVIAIMRREHLARVQGRLFEEVPTSNEEER
jgi:Mor family transcriptional regulator